jgi:Zn-dependent alcohol dehydrogenase
LTTGSFVGVRKGYASREIGVGMKPTRAQVGIAVVVVASSSTNAKLMAVGVDKNAVSRARGDGVEDVTTPRLVASVWEKVEHVLRW